MRRIRRQISSGYNSHNNIRHQAIYAGDPLCALLSALSGTDPRYALAELNELLTACPPMLFRELVSDATCLPVDPYLRNYVAAMTEQAAALKNVHPPEWTQTVTPLSTPHFATPMRSLRMHLLVSAPVPFKRRNIFVDSSIGARV